MSGAQGSLANVLDSLTEPGELYEKHADGSLTCYACGHRCLIKPGRRGICQVRFNQGGELRVPWGYVGALQCDPTEKKPFFHIYPGSDTLTFGMLGCDLHCPYCFPADTMVITRDGVAPIGDIFEITPNVRRTPDAEVAYPAACDAVTSTGQLHRIVKVFRHSYQGELTVIRPYYLPELRCTPDHRVYATTDPFRAPEKTPARELTPRHYLAVPRRYSFRRKPWNVDATLALGERQTRYKVPHDLSLETVQHIMAASATGVSSRALGLELGKDPSYIRHVRSKVRRGLWQAHRDSGLVVEGDYVRFPKEHRPGLRLLTPVGMEFARLLGTYCAEGSVVKDAKRPNSYSLVFAFGLHEAELAEETRCLLQTVLGVGGSVTRRSTTIAVTVNRTSVALLFEGLCGGGAAHKRVPTEVFDGPRAVVEAFLDAYLRGDGHHYPNGKISATTKSRRLAYAVAWLGLKTGHLPSVYENAVAAERLIEGRKVRQTPVQYTVVWYDNAQVARKAITTQHYYLVPVREVSSVPYAGDVYNLEAEYEHSYLANFAAVGNCQNWVTSQALRDPASEQAGAYPREVTPQQLAALARQQGAQLVGSSYNEPLITSEWAVAVFREAVAAGLKCVYISNGNATREVLEYIRPYVSGYKVDLKTMSDKNYRKLGAVLRNVLDGIRMVHALGFWLEIVTLVIPGFNDSPGELLDAARFLAELSPDIPWHVTAFHQDYRMTEPDNTTAQTLIRAAEIGQEAGLRYVYAGNLPGGVGEYEHTHCPTCQARLIARYGYIILDYRITARGTCPKCGTRIPGLWTDKPETVRLYGPGAPRAVRSVINRYRSDLARPTTDDDDQA
jgi:pyruvate formate lyase activating enzyme